MGELIFAMALFAAFSYGFVIVALETYGPSLQQFSTLSWAQTSVLLLQTGVIPYDEMEEANPWFTPLVSTPAWRACAAMLTFMRTRSSSSCTCWSSFSHFATCLCRS